MGTNPQNPLYLIDKIGRKATIFDCINSNRRRKSLSIVKSDSAKRESEKSREHRKRKKQDKHRNN